MTEANVNEVERIKTRIVSLLDARFSSDYKTYHNSKLGEDLGQDRIVLEQLTGLRLGQFIKENLDYGYDLIGENKNVLVILPKGETLASTESAVPRFSFSFWAAFAKPLAAGEQRFLNLDTQRFGPSKEELETDGSNVVEISAEYIAPEGHSGSAADTVARIYSWIEKNGFELSSFIAGNKKRRPPKDSFLNILLSSLTPSQLQRTRMPLDVIKTLSERER